MAYSKTKAREEFLKLARKAGELPTSAMAADEVPQPSAAAQRAAELLVGSLAGANSERAKRIAMNLDCLVALHRASAKVPKKSARSGTDG